VGVSAEEAVPAPEAALRNAIEGLEGWELIDEAFLHSAFTVGDLRDVLNELEAARAAADRWARGATQWMSERGRSYFRENVLGEWKAADDG